MVLALGVGVAYVVGLVCTVTDPNVLSLARDGAWALLNPALIGWVLFGPSLRLTLPVACIGVVTAAVADGGVGVSVENGLFACATLVIVRSFSDLYRTSSTEADAVEQVTNARVAAARGARLRIVQDHEAARLVHDEVLDALTVLAHIGQRIPEAVALDRCRRAVAQIAAGADDLAAALSDTRNVNIAKRIATALAAMPTTLQIDFADHTDGPVELALPAARALTNGVLEGIRNIERHAGTPHAAVRLERDRQDGSYRLSVLDDGVGLHPATVRRFGRSTGIFERLAEFGITMSVASRLPRGTALLFGWQRSDLINAYDTRVLDAVEPPPTWSQSVLPSTARGVFLVYLLPLGVALAVSIGWHLRDIAHPLLAALAICGSVALAVLASRCVASLTMSGATAAWLAVANIVTLLSGLASIRHGVADGYVYWAAGVSTPVVATIALLLPLGHSALVAAITASATGGTLAWVHGLGPVQLIGPTGIIVLAFAFGAAHRLLFLDLDASVRRAHRAAREVRMTAEVAAVAAEVELARLAHARRIVLPFLREVVGVGPTDETARTAAALARQSRARLNTPMLFTADPALARLCDAATARGVEIVLVDSPDDRVAREPVLAALLAEALARKGVDRVAAIWTSAERGGQDSMLFTIMCRDADTELGDRLAAVLGPNAEVLVDEGTVVCTTSLTSTQ